MTDPYRIGKPKVERFELVISFKYNQGITYLIDKEVRQIQRTLDGQIVPVNVPINAPAEIPRLIVQSGTTNVNICLNRLHLVTNVPSHIQHSIDESLEYLIGVAERCLRPLTTDEIRPMWIGLVGQINYPESPKRSASGIEAVSGIIPRILRSPINLPPAAFNLNYGVKNGEYNVHFNVSGYETISMLVEGNPAAALADGISLNSQILEVGIALGLDINNKGKTVFSGYDKEVTQIKDIFLSQAKSAVQTLGLEATP